MLLPERFLRIIYADCTLITSSKLRRYYVGAEIITLIISSLRLNGWEARWKKA